MQMDEIIRASVITRQNAFGRRAVCIRSMCMLFSPCRALRPADAFLQCGISPEQFSRAIQQSALGKAGLRSIAVIRYVALWGAAFVTPDAGMHVESVTPVGNAAAAEAIQLLDFGSIETFAVDHDVMRRCRFREQCRAADK
jgi:hypothetical protein